MQQVRLSESDGNARAPPPIEKASRLQNSRFRTFSEGGKRRKRDPRLCEAREPHMPVVRIWSVARVRKK